MKRVTMTKWESDYFPVMLTWSINGTKYSDVFVSKEAARGYAVGRFGKCTIIDKTGGEK